MEGINEGHHQLLSQDEALTVVIDAALVARSSNHGQLSS
jgi:hypothetical protein